MRHLNCKPKSLNSRSPAELQSFSKEDAASALLVDAGRSFPIDNVYELPSILIELKLQLPLFVDHELSCGIQHTCAFTLVRVVQVEFSGCQVEGTGLRVPINFTESEQAVGDEANLATSRSRYHLDETEVVAKCAGDRYTAHSFHLGERIDQSLIL